jgi:glycine/D-amino acid oxidase-like deaminating enzyme
MEAWAREWDVVVVGTGMGGATIGHALVERGHRVLFLECGDDPQAGATGPRRGLRGWLRNGAPTACGRNR